MAERWAVATGNWSATGTWNGGTLPGSGDDVYSNTFTVTIDQDVTVNSLRNTAGTTPAAGGVFTCSSTRTLTLAGGIVTGTVDCVTCTANTLTISGGGTITGGTSANADGLAVTGTGSAVVNNPVNGGTTSSSSGIVFTSSGTLTIAGGVTLAGASGSAINRNAGTTGTLTIGASGNPCTLSCSTSTACVSVTTAVTTATIYANSGTLSGTGAALQWGTTAAVTIVGNFTAQTGIGISVTGASTGVTITGNITGSATSTTAYGIWVTGSCTLTVTGAVTAGAQGHGMNIQTVTTATIIVDEVVGNSRGIGSTDLIAFAIANASLPTTGTVKVKTATCGPNGAWPISGPAFIQTLSSGTVKVRDSLLTQSTYQQSSGSGAVPQFKRQPIMAGDYRKGDIVYITTTTMGASGPTTASGLTLACYEDGTASAITAGVTTVFSGGFGSMAGCVNVAIDTSNAAYTAGKNYAVIATAGTVSGSSIVGDVLGRFSVQKESRSALSTLDPSSGVTTNSTLQTIAGYIDTEVAAIKAKTDNLPASPANEATLTTIASYIDTEVAAIKAKTDNLPASPANEATLTTVASNVVLIYGAVDTETSAGAIRTALGMASANLDTQITNIPKNVWLYDFLAALPQTVPRYSPWSAMRTIMRWFVTSSTTKRVYKEDGTTAFDTTISNDGAGGITGDDKP